MKKVCSHTSKSTATYLKKEKPKKGVKCVPFQDIFVKLLHASYMNISAFDLLKQAFGRCQSRTL